ncbi:MAG: hypothetical protein EBZ78_13815, partial [Verrucomicrobia bacterium]|nr:hypothetical protein [Verrucomicrobiota bacterium]
TDGDGLTDGQEVNVYGTNPSLADTDGDGVSDGVELTAGTDPKLASSNPKPVIASQPGAATNSVGGNASFSVVATNPVFNSIQGSGAGVLPGTRDANWRIVAVPAGFTPPETVPYPAFVPATVPTVYAGGYGNAGVNGTRWIAPAATTTAILGAVNGSAVSNGNAYHWIAAQTFSVADEGMYEFNFPAAGDNAIEFYIDGAVDTSEPARPTIRGGTQIGTRQEGFGSLNSYQGRVYLTAGIHTASMVLIDWGGATAAIIGPSQFAVGLSYQWKQNGEDVPGATNAVLTFTDLRVDRAGDYRVAVANAYGSVTSNIARLTVNKATPTISVAPTASGITFGQ